MEALTLHPVQQSLQSSYSSLTTDCSSASDLRQSALWNTITSSLILLCTLKTLARTESTDCGCKAKLQDKIWDIENNWMLLNFIQRRTHEPVQDFLPRSTHMLQTQDTWEPHAGAQDWCLAEEQNSATQQYVLYGFTVPLWLFSRHDNTLSFSQIKVRQFEYWQGGHSLSHAGTCHLFDLACTAYMPSQSFSN